MREDIYSTHWKSAAAVADRTIDTCLVLKTVTLKILMLVIIISVISQVVQGCKPKAIALPP